MADESSANSLRLLVVDDEVGMREMLEMMLKSRGHHVTSARSAADAMTKLSAEPFDLVLSDVKMPERDGLSLLADIRAAQLPVTVLMMSAYVEMDTAIEAVKLGAADYVSKPFRAEEVMLKIHMAWERHRLLEERERLEAENAQLKAARGQAPNTPSGMIGQSERMRKVYTVVDKVASYKSTVLLLGESGTGKELIARALHARSSRAEAPFIAINCGAIPETLLESELFGHSRGAFTDASREKLGLIREANSGTLFLDEIGELPQNLQVKLLRFLQEGEVRPVGENKPIEVDVRVVAATARKLNQMVEEGSFREDLFYRLNVMPIEVPPLRERREDIPALVHHFIDRHGPDVNRTDVVVSSAALKALVAYGWPGNVRELENVIERTLVLLEGDRIELGDLPSDVSGPTRHGGLQIPEGTLSIKKTTRMLERTLIERSLETTGGNRTQAAKLLEISHRALLYKIKEYGLS
ncbi:MAG: sigma-54 dependent transcriptional regulator [Myxococcota bacterium]|nr:sigma-54 dependent transcriptional regulator [Myxococcota bacterium]